ncbi:MAG: methyltransferase domain-containing protein [Bacillota bacterium]
MIDKAQVRKNFGRGAVTYDCYAGVQKRMARGLLDRIKSSGKDFRDILEIGCGTGFLTELLVRGFPGAHILAVDISPQMIEAARGKFASCPNVSYLVADGENLHIGGSFDLIVSSAVFQWFNSYLRPFSVYYQLLRENGWFIFNTLGEKTFNELARTLALLGLASPRAAFINVEELGRVLAGCGFAEWSIEERMLKDYYLSARELLAGIKRIGAQTHCFSAAGTYLKTDEIFKLINLYDGMYRQDDRVYTSYQVLYGSARKGRGTF